MDAEQFANPAWNRRSERLGRRIARALIRDAVLAVILLATGEGAVRVFFPEYAQLLFTKTLTGGHPKGRNSRGLRNPEFTVKRPESETRLLCIGDSVTFGAGVAASDTYAAQLDALLNSDSPDGNSYFVINAGGEGRSLDAALDYLETEGIALEPSVVILGFSPSILAVTKRAEAGAVASKMSATGASAVSIATRLKRTLRYAATSIQARLNGSYLFVFFDANFRRQLYRLGVLRDRMDKPVGAIFAYAFDVPGVNITEVETAYEVFAARLEQTKALLDARGIGFMVLGIPSRFRISESKVDNERGFELFKMRIRPIDRIGEYCRKSGVPYVNLLPLLQARRQEMLDGKREWNDLYVRFDYAHLNPRGLHLAAEALRERLGELGWP